MNTALNFINTHNAYLIYTVLFIFVFLENAVPFVPDDFVLLVSAYLSGREILDSYLTFILTVVAAVLGFVVVFFIGLKWGRSLIEQRHSRLVSTKKLSLVDHYYHKYGYWILAIGRFIPGIRFILALSAGFTRLKVSRSFLYTGISIVLWNGLIFQVGRLLGENWDLIRKTVQQYNTIANLLLLFIILLICIGWLRHKRKSLGVHAND